MTAVRFFLPGQGPGTTSYSMPCSSSAFCTFQHGWPENLTQMFGQRCNFTAMAPPSTTGSYDTRMRAVFAVRPPAWGETLAILQSVSLPDGPEQVRARVVAVEGERVTIDFPALDGE